MVDPIGQQGTRQVTVIHHGLHASNVKYMVYTMMQYKHARHLQTGLFHCFKSLNCTSYSYLDRIKEADT